MTFVHSTYVIPTFVNIGNISHFTDPISWVYKVHICKTEGGIRVHPDTFWTKKFFLLKIFLITNSFNLNIWGRILWFQNFLDPRFLLAHKYNSLESKFLGPNFYFNPNFLNQKFFGIQFFLTYNFFEVKIFGDLDFFGPKFFGPRFFNSNCFGIEA